MGENEIDPDAPEVEGAERDRNKGFGENVKDAAHDLKEDAKDVFRRSDDDEGESSSSDDEEPSSDDGDDREDDERASADES